MTESLNLLKFLQVRGILTGLVILGAAWLVGRFLSRLLDRLGGRFTERRLQIHLVGTFTRFFLYIGALIAAVLLSFRLSDQMLFAMGGSIAVAVGFALKDLAASVIAGLTILADKPFQVGDRVTFAGHYGEVVVIGLRSVRLLTLDDSVVTIPNNKFFSEVVSSGNAGALDMLVQMDFYVGIDQDIASAKRVVAEALTSTRFGYLAKPWNVLVNQVVQDAYIAVRLRAKVYVLDVKYEKALETDVTERVLEGFRREGIQPPAVLHRTLPSAPASPHGAAAGTSSEHRTV
jgi:small-conductance mechanosensitive channel